MSAADEAAKVPAPLARAQAGVCLGCGALIALSFLALAYTVWWSDRRFSDDPVAVERTFRSIVSCAFPPGYRGFQAAVAPDGQRIAVAAPATMEGKRIDLRASLLLSAWRFPAKRPADPDPEEQILRFWRTQVGDREVFLGKLLRTREADARLRVGAREWSGREVRFECARRSVRLLLFRLPADDEGAERWLAFAGDAASFDERALEEFLGSVVSSARRPGRPRPASRD
ncbi:MAG: hypothetical protein D6731_13275 [Planctomycetota bacterium]|nr:MAG: hypothetical protein D6731_13275 [Planctomycetota bacterium]